MMFDCPQYIQSGEKGASLSIRNACLRCGRTKEAHKVEPELPSDELAAEWLVSAGYKGQPYFELVRVILTRYIEHRRQS